MTTLVVGIICFFVGGFAGVLVISICHAAKQVPDLDDFGRMATLETPISRLDAHVDHCQVCQTGRFCASGEYLKADAARYAGARYREISHV